MYNFSQSNETVFKTDNFPKLNSTTKYFLYNKYDPTIEKYNILRLNLLKFKKIV